MKTKLFTLIIAALFTLQLSAQNDITAYAWKAGTYSTPLCQGPLSMTIPGGELTSIACYEDADYYFIHGGDWINNKWYGLIYDTMNGDCPLVIIDTITGELQFIANTVPSVTGLAHDYSTNTTYILGFSGFMGEIDLGTGAVTDLGYSGVTDAIALACDTNGNLYAVSNDDNLHKIDIQEDDITSEVVGPLGISQGGETGLCFDRNTNKLYGSLSGWGGAVRGLYEIDINTGEATLLQETGYSIAGLAIPYTLVANHDLGVSAVTPGLTHEVGDGIFPTATIENTGNIEETTYEIEYIISDGSNDVYTSTKTISQTILPGNELEITMDDEWAPEFLGVYTIAATVTANEDSNVVNNTLISTCDVHVDIENYLAEEIKVYPVPSNGVFNIDIKEELHLIIYDQTGRPVLNQVVNGSAVIDLTKNAAGLYLMNFINNKGENYTRRVVVE